MLLGVDIGGTGCKTLLLSEEGAVVACASRTYSLRHPRPGWAEIEPDEWWQAFLHNLGELSRLADLRTVRAIGVSCTNAWLGVDAIGNVLVPAVMFMDQRSAAACSKMQAQVPQEELLAATGNRIMPGTCAASTMSHVAAEQPDLYRRIWKFMAPSSYFVYRLTGELAMDRSRATPTALFDIRADTWSARICGMWNIDVARLPPIRNAWDVVGRITKSAAKETGLDRSAVVVTGGADSACAALGAGVVGPGDLCEVSGTATVLLASAPQPSPDPRFMTIHHVVKGQYLCVAPMSSVGSALKWFRDAFYTETASKPDIYERMFAEAVKSQPGANGLLFLPYLSGERAPVWDSCARGVFFGISLSHTRSDFLRAVLESAGYGLKWNMEALAEHGIPRESVRCVGGQAQSKFWTQLKSDITQRRYHVLANHDASALGAAMLAGQGICCPVRDALCLNPVQCSITPAREYKDLYERNTVRTKEIYAQVKGLFAG